MNNVGYKPADFLRPSYWRLRGKLDVPKERFILYPLAERASDSSPVLGWAGWNHLEQAQALSAYYVEMQEQESWSADRLAPLLTGLLELVPWLKQWHNEPDPELDLRMGEYFDGFVEQEARGLGYTVEQLRAWTPPAGALRKKRGGRRKNASRKRGSA